MSNGYHCSLSAISYQPGKGRGRMFFRQRRIVPVPWSTIEGMHKHIGFIQGEWKLSTNWLGHVQGLPHIQGAMIARSGTRALLWTETGKIHLISGSNFVGQYEDELPKVAS